MVSERIGRASENAETERGARGREDDKFCAGLLDNPRRTVGAALEASVARGVDFLRRRQESNGEFAIYMWRDDYWPNSRLRDHAVTVAAFVLHATRYLQASQGAGIAAAAIRFLIREMQPPAVWSYWTAESGKRTDPDLDDTAMISFVLKCHHPDIARGSNLATILSARNREGLFRTWIRAPERPNDVDSVVNANVVLYLGERPETAAACDYLRACVESDQESGSYWYYLHDAALHYAISRAFRHGVRALGGLRDALVDKAVARQCPDGSFGDELNTAWTLCTLFNVECGCSEAVTKAVGWLIARQLQHGGWSCVAATTGPEPPAARSIWWGSEELTTAACIEALARAAALWRRRCPPFE